VERAFAIAANEPAGPVYLTLPREVLMLPANNVRMPTPNTTNRATPAAADTEAIEQAAHALANATRPLIVAGRNGRDPASAEALGRRAEQAGARMVHASESVSARGNHPLNLGPTWQPSWRGRTWWCSSIPTCRTCQTWPGLPTGRC